MYQIQFVLKIESHHNPFNYTQSWSVVYFSYEPFTFLLLLISTPVLCVTYNAEVIRVIDGDSVHLRDGDGLRHKVRLFGIDSPEMRQKYGAKAGRYLASRIGGEFVTATVVDRDAYQREVVIFMTQT